MKKGWKIFWIVCGICAGIGFVCCVISWMLGVTVTSLEERFPDGIVIGKHIICSNNEYVGDWDINGDTDIIEGNASMNFTTRVSGIDIGLWGGDIRIRKSTGGSKEISVETKDVDARLGLRCYMDGDELKIRTNKKVTGMKEGTGTIYVDIPEDCYLEECLVDIGAGYLYIEDVRAQELSIDVGAGKAEIDSFTAEEAELDCGTGSIHAAGDVSDEINIDCGIGEIYYTAAGCETDYDYDVECGIGEVRCGQNRYSGLAAGKDIYNEADRLMDIECGIGKVVVDFAEESAQEDKENTETHHTETNHTESLDTDIQDAGMYFAEESCA